MKTMFIKNYVDQIMVYESSGKDFELLTKNGYEVQTEESVLGGEGDKYVELTMLFGDGIAYDTDMNGIAMMYPTLAEVAESEKMQRIVWQTTCRDEITPYDIALAFGEVKKYKLVADYPTWCKQNDFVEIYAVCADRGDWDEIYFDVFEDDFYTMYDNDEIECRDGSYLLLGNPTEAQIDVLREKYGILWTENIGTTIIKRKGVPNKGYEIEEVA